MPVFKAQLLPSSTFQPSFVPTLETYVTDPEPFTLQTEIRGEQHVQKWKEQVTRFNFIAWVGFYLYEAKKGSTTEISPYITTD